MLRSQKLHSHGRKTFQNIRATLLFARFNRHWRSKNFDGTYFPNVEAANEWLDTKGFFHYYMKYYHDVDWILPGPPSYLLNCAGLMQNLNVFSFCDKQSCLNACSFYRNKCFFCTIGCRQVTCLDINVIPVCLVLNNKPGIYVSFIFEIITI
jgi:hypothetical protein